MRQSFSSDHNLKPATGALAVLIGTRKGAFILRGDAVHIVCALSGRI